MATQVIMPQLGESVIEGTITKWLKNNGEQVKELEPLLEVNTDKVDTEIPSPISGILLKILIPEGKTVQAGTVLAWIGKTDEKIPENGPESSQREEQAKPAAQPVQAEAGGEAVAPGSMREQKRDIGFISPVVSKMAQEYNIDLTQVQGTGQGGRITKKDVMAYLEEKQKAVEAETVTPVTETAPVSQTANQVEAQPKPEPKPVEISAIPMEGEIQPLSPVRRAIADHMVMSKRTSPHVTTVMEADISRVVAHREANKASFARDGVNLTYTAYLVAATVMALKAYPVVNSSWTDEGVLIHRQIHIGMATSMGEAGLIVPVIKDADQLSLLGLARTINDLSSRARARKLQPDEVKGGTFTITNHGVTGSLFATPIINQPQCGILGAGAIQKRVVAISQDGVDAIAIRPMVYLSLTFDHRILDGAIADYFLGRVVESLQNWGST